MESAKVKGIVYAVVIAILGLVFYTPLTGGADTLFREFIPHCETSTGQTAVLGKVISGSNNGTTFTLDASCMVPASTVATDGDKVGLDNGNEFAITTAATAQAIPSLKGTGPVDPPPVLTQFASINRLLIQLLPLLLVISFIGSGVMSGMNITGGGNIQTAIKYEVMILILALVGVNLAPTLFEFIGDAASTTDGSRSVTGQFSGIIDLIFGILPILITIGLMSLVSYRTYSQVRQRAEGQGQGAAMGGAF